MFAFDDVAFFVFLNPPMGLELLEVHKIRTLQSNVEMRHVEQDLETQVDNRLQYRITIARAQTVTNNNTLNTGMRPGLRRSRGIILINGRVHSTTRLEKLL